MTAVVKMCSASARVPRIKKKKERNKQTKKSNGMGGLYIRDTRPRCDRSIAAKQRRRGIGFRTFGGGVCDWSAVWRHKRSLRFISLGEGGCLVSIYNSSLTSASLKIQARYVLPWRYVRRHRIPTTMRAFFCFSFFVCAATLVETTPGVI